MTIEELEIENGTLRHSVEGYKFLFEKLAIEDSLSVCKLMYWRKKKGLSIRDLATLAGVSSATIVKVEKTGSPPIPSALKRLATALELSTQDLFEKK